MMLRCAIPTVNWLLKNLRNMKKHLQSHCGRFHLHAWDLILLTLGRNDLLQLL